MSELTVPISHYTIPLTDRQWELVEIAVHLSIGVLKSAYEQSGIEKEKKQIIDMGFEMAGLSDMLEAQLLSHAVDERTGGQC